MKKLLFFLGLMLLSGAIFAQQLSFRFANPQIIRLYSVDNLQFDVQVMASTPTYLWSTQVALSFDNTTFDNNTSDWTITRVGPFSGNNTSSNSKYSVTIQPSGTVPGKICGIGLTADVNKLGATPADNNFASIPTSWITMITVSIPLSVASGDGMAGIDFLETPMNGEDYYISAPNTTLSYLNPNLYDSRDFLTAFTGRIYSTGTNDWSQVGGPTDGVQYKNLGASVSTTVWDGAASIPSGTSLAKALQIQNPATLTIPVNGALTVTGATEIDTPGGLVIQSDATGTGSLITGSVTGSGTTVAQSYLTTGAWHLVSSPVVQSVASFLTTNSNVPTNNAARGMMDYNPASNSWNSFFTNGIGGNVGGGKGFCLRSSANGIVSFTGALQAGNQSVTGLGATYWNCVGNPYSSAIGINSASTSGATNNFLTVNTSNLDPSYGAVYIWQQPDASNGQTGKYTAVSNLNGALDVQQGQAYMVKMNSGITSLSFTPAMQFHSPSLTLKAAENVWPTIKLIATADPQTNYTTIAFNSGMTKGLDPTYDAGLLKGGTDLLIYTKLVEDNGIPFAIQALPDNNFDKMIIPVGLDFKTGGDVVFSAETTNLPGDCKVILEDIPAAVFTDLSNAVYKVTIPANSVITDRFRLHTSLVSSVIDPVLESTLNAYAFMNIEIRIVGEVSSNAVATLYQVDGKAMIIQKLAEGSLNVIPISSFNTGLYILTVRDGVKLHTFKIPLKR